MPLLIALVCLLLAVYGFGIILLWPRVRWWSLVWPVSAIVVICNLIAEG